MTPLDQLPKAFDADTAERHWYARWKALGLFETDAPAPTAPSTAASAPTASAARPYVIVIPPPNVTGVLHMGHMLNNTIQDLLVRRRRLEGQPSLWVPGTDHASIATEAKVVQLVRSEGSSKAELGREGFIARAIEWKNKYGGIILQQLERLGAGLDWRRTAYTMETAADPTQGFARGAEHDYHQAVIDVFVDLYRDGLIYRAKRLVNWDPQAQTTLSDEEVLYKEATDPLVTVRYPVVDANGRDTGEFIEVATTRPETIPADQAIAVAPEHPRFGAFVGRRVRIPLLERTILVIEDADVDPEFGTGALKITPAHDKVDYAIGQRHGLTLDYDVLNPDGTLNAKSILYAGLDRFEARAQSIARLREAGFVVKEERHTHNVGTSERTGAVIEPRLMEQWFVDMKKLAAPALAAVEEGRVTLVPDKFVSTYRHWMENVQDWCISRQLWWGHRIPVWVAENGEVICAHDGAEAQQLAAAKGITGPLAQDPDVLDTWFSSWLWPIAVFDATVFRKQADGSYPRGNADLNYFYPTATLVTAPEILFFWVARMIMAGLRYRGQVPFTHVYLTGIVRDGQGRKMSKSLGNSPEPMELIAKYSADGVRVGMLLSSPAGNDLLFDPDLCEQGRNFSNKIWNALRLVAGWGERLSEAEPTPAQQLTQRWIDARLAQAEVELQAQFDGFRLSEALMNIYKLVWDDFCAWYLELLKPAATDGVVEPLPRATFEAVITTFERLMALLNPFMPFVTESVWQHLRPRAERESLCAQRLAEPVMPPDAAILIERMGQIRELATQLRALRNDRGLSPKVPLPLVIRTEEAAFFDAYLPLIRRQAGLGEWSFGSAAPAGSATLVLKQHELYVSLPVGDTASERDRLEKEIAYAEGFLQSVQAKLSNQKFVANAKPEVLERERQKQADAEAKLRALRGSLASLS